MNSDTPPRLTFPCSYPIKVMVRADPGVRQQVDRIIEQHAGPLDPGAVSERPSARNRFIGITYIIEAQGESHIAALFTALKECPQVVMVL